MKCANENGFSVIRLLQKDVFNNKYNWLNELISNIEKISHGNTVQNIFMSKHDNYKDYL
jgi:very-short-patch-repair endonuclease